MKNLISNRIVLAVFFFVIGGLSAWEGSRYLVQRKTQFSADPSVVFQHEPDRFFEDFFNDDKGSLENTTNPFFEMGGKALGDIKQREDKQYVYYDIDLKGQDPKELKIEVKNGEVTISGQTETKENRQGESSYFSSSFHRAFPVPDGVNGQAFKMERQDQKIILKFPKTTSAV